MKLSTVALSVAVILGAVATGGSWYTGKQVEQRYHELVAQGNSNLKELESLGIQAQIKNVKFERNFFSSDVSYEVEAKMDDKAFMLKGSDKVHHGPFPLNRVVKGKIVPVMASIDSTLTSQENTDLQFAKPEVLVGQTDVSYSSDLDGSFKLSAFKGYENVFDMGETDVDFEWKKSGAGSAEVKIPQIRVTNPESKEEFTFNEMQYALTFPKEAKDYSSLALGKAEAKIKSIVFRDTYRTSGFNGVEISNLGGKSENKVANELYEGVGDVSAKIALVSADEKRTELGKFTADFFMKSDAKATDSLMKFAQMDPEMIQPDEMMPHLKALFAKDVQFHLKNVSFENEKGQHTLSLVMNTNPFNPETLSGLEEIIAIFKQSKINLVLNLAAFEEMLKQLEMAGPHADQANNAEASAKAATDQLVGFAQSNGNLLKVDPDNITFNLAIDQGKVMLNGKEIPPEEIFITLLSLGIGLGK